MGNIKRVFVVSFVFFIFSLSVFSQKKEKINIMGYNHVSLQVRNLTNSLNFYKEIIGLEQLPRPNFATKGAWLKVPHEVEELHLIEGRKDSVISDMTGSTTHFSWQIPDVKAAEKYLKTTNVTIHKQSRVDGVMQLYLLDPDGYLIELTQYPKKK